MSNADTRLAALETRWPPPVPAPPSPPAWALRAARRVTGGTGPAPAAVVTAYAVGLVRDELTPAAMAPLSDRDLEDMAAELAPEFGATVDEVLEEIRGLAGRAPG